MTRILIIEDSATQAEELAFLLESRSYAVDVARDGVSGLEKCRAGQYDAVLSDVVMPGMDGYELCRRVKSDARVHDLPVILLTSLTEPLDIIRGLECGADNFITKPYDVEYLVARVEQLLQNRKLRAHRKLDVGVDLVLMGKRFTINSQKEQMVDLLLSTFEEVLRSRQREYEAKVAEESHRRSHQLLQSALDALSSQIAIVDDGGKIIAVNAAWRHMADISGWTWESCGVGTDYRGVLERGYGTDPEHVREALAGVGEVQAGREQYFHLEYPAKIRDESRWFALSATRFEGAGLALLALENEDITQSRRLEQQLRQSQKMEAIGQLAGGLAHDFNNLLSVITGYGQLLLREFPQGDTKRDDLEQMLEAAKRAAALTRQLLSFSRRSVVQPAVLELNSVVSGVEKMLTRVIGEDIDLVTALDAHIGRIQADAGQLEQVLVNLAVNARDAMPDGGKLTIETSSVTLDESYTKEHNGVKPGEYVVLAVTDTGTGMDAETQARIFEPFFTTKEVGRGTGLGLSMVYGIVQQSDGHIWVYSEVGCGTTFKIYLPVVGDAATRREERAVSAPPVGHERILLIEDEDAVRVVAVRILREHGYTVFSASGASQARAVCAEVGASIDLLLTDVVMREANGPELAAELLRDYPQMRVLFMSGYSGKAVFRHGSLQEGAPFLEKPFAPESLARKVREVLDQGK